MSVLAVSASFAGSASASEIVTRNGKNPRLKVDAKGHAVVYWGTTGHAVFWGAVNGRSPSRTIPQVSFKKDYSGGYVKLGYPLWKTIRNRCRPYDGPKLPWFVAGCKAPDGSYWALQRWQRMLPNLGYKPWKASQRAWELHLSHWTGAPAELVLHTDWAYSSKFHHLFGKFTYRGHAVYGFSFTTTGIPLDSYGRNIYVDTYNSRYGAGWKRENSWLSHRSGGNFCYLFFARPSYYDSTTRVPGNGKRYRATAVGPGVSPDVGWSGAGLPAYDPNNPEHVALETEMNALNKIYATGDDRCQVN